MDAASCYMSDVYACILWTTGKSDSQHSISLFWVQHYYGLSRGGGSGHLDVLVSLSTNIPLLD